MAWYYLIFFFSLFYLWPGRGFPSVTVKMCSWLNCLAEEDEYYELIKLPVLLGRWTSAYICSQTFNNIIDTEYEKDK